MDDLADAIQDAAYIGAMCTNVPQPVVPLTLPSPEEARAVFARQDPMTGGGSHAHTLAHSSLLAFESVLAEPLGWYLFKKYLREDPTASQRGACGDVCMEFIEEVTAYASIGRPGLRLARAQEIVHTYLRRRSDATMTGSAITLDDTAGRRGTGAASTPSRAASPSRAVHVASAEYGVTDAAAAARGTTGRLPSSASQESVGTMPRLDGGTTRVDARAEASHTHGLSLGGGSSRAGGVADVPEVMTTGCSCRSMSRTAPQPAGSWLPSNKQDVLFRPGSRPHAAIAARRDPEAIAAAASLYAQYKDPSAVLHVSGRLVEAIIQLVNDHSAVKHSEGGTTFYEASLSASSPSFHGTAQATSEVVTRTADSAPVGGSSTDLVADAARATGYSAAAQAELGVPRRLFDALRDVVFEGLRQRHWRSYVSNHSAVIRYMQFKTLEARPVAVSDFSLFRVLGRGGFGVVHACKKSNTGRLYAMKAMSKHRIKAKSAGDLCWNERIVLGKVDSPFVISLKYAFQTNEDVYLILDLATGGDLAYHLAKEVRFTEERARFYAAQILLGLEHLHSLQIVYRDLKPENILLDEHGNARISDMGLATHVLPNLCGRCGTRGYWAPEMLVKHDGKRQTYGLAVDWWSFGCLLYEFLSGKCPFRTEAARSLDPDKHKSMDKATLHLEVPYDERYFSPAARSLVQCLLVRDPARRLGARGAVEIKAHPFFDAVDWGLLEAGLLPAPWVPETSINAAAQDMIGAFDDNTKKITLDEEDQARFAGWEVTNKYAFQQEMVDFLIYEDTRGPVEPSARAASWCGVQ